VVEHTVQDDGLAYAYHESSQEDKLRFEYSVERLEQDY